MKNRTGKSGLLFGDEFLLSRGFGNWYEFFRYLKDKGRIVVAIDEFPFLIEANSAVPSIFQKGWDEDLKDASIFLVLLGSSIGMMETEVLGYRSPEIPLCLKRAQDNPAGSACHRDLIREKQKRHLHN